MNSLEQRTGFRPAGAWANLGEQLLAVREATINPASIDARLQLRAAAGGSEAVPSDGGFAVDAQFVPELLGRAYATGEFLGRARRVPITNGRSNSLKIPAFDETSRATGSRFGGVRTYWLNEADTATASRPKVRLQELPLHKLVGLLYVTDEVLQDAGVLSSFISQAFPEEMAFAVELSAAFGQGAGQLVGFMSSPALITVPKETGQAAASIVAQNILGMWARCWGPSRSRAVWFVNPEAERQLLSLTVPVGTGGSALPLYKATVDPDNQPYNLLLGRPVVPAEWAKVTGTPGDLILADPAEYLFTERDGIQAASSLHVRFLINEMAFRFTWRCNGAPTWSKPVTPLNGTDTVSPFVALGPRV